jgi:biotin carboxyl carrier protein
MRYKAIVHDKTVEVTFERTSTGINATIDGRAYSMDLTTVNPGVFLLNWGHRSIEVTVLLSGELSSESTVSIGEHRIPVKILDSRRRVQGTTRSGGMGASEIRSPMPGKIVRVLAVEGSEVEERQGIVVMEAMKMQNEIKSLMSGRIRKLAVAEGDAVQSGDLIAIVDATLMSE